MPGNPWAWPRRPICSPWHVGIVVLLLSRSPALGDHRLSLYLGRCGQESWCENEASSGCLAAGMLQAGPGFLTLPLTFAPRLWKPNRAYGLCLGTQSIESMSECVALCSRPPFPGGSSCASAQTSTNALLHRHVLSRNLRRCPVPPRFSWTPLWVCCPLLRGWLSAFSWTLK